MQNDTPTSPLSQDALSRRGFLVTLTGGLSIGFFLPLGGRLIEEAHADGIQEHPMNAWIRIGSNGSITLLFGGCEMGQGSMSGLCQILAEELKVAWNQVILEQSDANAAISYTTAGSSAVARRFTTLRIAGATARELLVAAAMIAKGDNTRANFVAANAVVSHTPTGQSWTYGGLAEVAASSAASALLPATIPLTNPADFTLIGKPLPRPDIPLKTNGTADYGIDVFLPGMVFAVIKHCPTIGGTLASPPATPSGALAVVPCTAWP